MPSDRRGQKLSGRGSRMCDALLRSGCVLHGAAHRTRGERRESTTPKRSTSRAASSAAEAYLKINPLGRVPALRLDDGDPLTENAAILPYLGKRFGLWPSDAAGRSQGAVRSSGSSPRACIRPTRISAGRNDMPPIRAAFPASRKPDSRRFRASCSRSTACSLDANGLSDDYRVLDPYALVFYSWGLRASCRWGNSKNYTAFKERMLGRPAVARGLDR